MGKELFDRVLAAAQGRGEIACSSSAVCLVLMVVLVGDVFLGVFSRYVHAGDVPLVRRGGAALLRVDHLPRGGGGGAPRRLHFRMHLLVDRFGPAARRHAGRLGPADAHRASASSSWRAASRIAPIAHRQVTDALEISQLWFFGALPVGGALMILFALPQLRRPGVRPMTLVSLALPRAPRRGRAGGGGGGRGGLRGGHPRLARAAGRHRAADAPPGRLVRPPRLPALRPRRRSLMESGGIARRLVDLAVALVGWVRGGLGMAVMARSTSSPGISGSTVADVSAMASTPIPPMVRAGYSNELAMAIVSAASAMGILVPPCILMIVIGSIAGLSVAALFTAGFVPAVVLAVAVMIASTALDGRQRDRGRARPGHARELGGLRRAIIPLGMPVIIFGGIFGGIITLTEASVVAVLYAALVGPVRLPRDPLGDAARDPLLPAATMTGAVGCSSPRRAVISWFLTVQQLPPRGPAQPHRAGEQPGVPRGHRRRLHPLRRGRRGPARDGVPAADPPADGAPARHRPASTTRS